MTRRCLNSHSPSIFSSRHSYRPGAINSLLPFRAITLRRWQVADARSPSSCTARFEITCRSCEPRSRNRAKRRANSRIAGRPNRSRPWGYPMNVFGKNSRRSSRRRRCRARSYSEQTSRKWRAGPRRTTFVTTALRRPCPLLPEPRRWGSRSTRARSPARRCARRIERNAADTRSGARRACLWIKARSCGRRRRAAREMRHLHSPRGPARDRPPPTSSDPGIIRTPEPPQQTHQAYGFPVPSPRIAGRGAILSVSVRAEAEQFRGIVGGDLAAVLLGHAGEDAVEELLRLRPGRFGMREIAAPQHVVDADYVADLHTEVVFHEFDEHVAPPILARQHALARLPALGEHRPLAIHEIHLLQPMRDPHRLVLDRADLEPRVAVEYAGEQHCAQRIAHPVIGRRAAGAGHFVGIYREFVAGNVVARCRDMQQQRDVEILRGPPQPLVDRMAIGFVGQWGDRDEGADQTQFLASLQLLAGLIDIVDTEHRNTLQALWIGLAEIGDPVVVDAADFGQELAVGHAVPEEALARLQARAPNAVLFILGDHRMRVVSALAHILPNAQKIDLRRVLEALAGLHYRTQGADLRAVEHPGVIFPTGRGLVPLYPRRPLAKFGLDPGRIHVRRLDDMRIRRDHFVRSHFLLSSVAADGFPSAPQNNLGRAILSMQTVCRERPSRCADRSLSPPRRGEGRDQCPAY